MSTSASFNKPRNMAFDSSGNLYVTDNVNGSVRRITPAGSVSTFASGLTDPNGIAIDAAGNLYVTETSLYILTRITPGGIKSVFAGTSGSSGSTNGSGSQARFNMPFGLSYDGSDYLYLADAYNQTIRRIELATAAVSNVAGLSGQTAFTDGSSSSARFN